MTVYFVFELRYPTSLSPNLPFSYFLSPYICPSPFLSHSLSLLLSLTLSSSHLPPSLSSHPTQMITAQPDITVTPLTAADQFIILGCDGIWDCLSCQEAVSAIEKNLNNLHLTFCFFCSLSHSLSLLLSLSSSRHIFFIRICIIGIWLSSCFFLFLLLYGCCYCGIAFIFLSPFICLIWSALFTSCCCWYSVI